jgi:hypothetical protein
MAGRIRTLKPEILEDDRTASLSDVAWRTFVSLIVMADDYGNFRAHPHFVLATAFWGHPDKDVREIAESLDTLEDVGLIERYSVRGQTYGHVRNWEKHQRVDNAGKARVPGKDDPEAWMQTQMYVYFVQQGENGPIKIGRASNVARRVRQIQVSNPAPLRLLASIDGDREMEMHERFMKSCISGEWFKPEDELLQFLRELAASSPLAGARAQSGGETPTTDPDPDHRPPRGAAEAAASTEQPTTITRLKASTKTDPKGSHIHASWQPSAETLAWASGKGVDGNACVEEFVDFWRTVPGAKGRKADWDLTLKARIRKLIEDERAPMLPVQRPSVVVFGERGRSDSDDPITAEQEAELENLFARGLKHG